MSTVCKKDDHGHGFTRLIEVSKWIVVNGNIINQYIYIVISFYFFSLMFETEKYLPTFEFFFYFVVKYFTMQIADDLKA